MVFLLKNRMKLKNQLSLLFNVSSSSLVTTQDKGSVAVIVCYGFSDETPIAK